MKKQGKDCSEESDMRVLLTLPAHLPMLVLDDLAHIQKPLFKLGFERSDVWVTPTTLGISSTKTKSMPNSQKVRQTR